LPTLQGFCAFYNTVLGILSTHLKLMMGGDDKHTTTAGEDSGPSAAAETLAAPAHEAGETADDAAAPTSTLADDDHIEAAPTPGKSADEADKKSSEDTVATAAADEDQDDPAKAGDGVADNVKPVAIVSSSKKARPPYKYDPTKITLRFLFANRDGLTVTVECKPNDTVGEVKGALLSVWPEGKISPVCFLPF
jgi:hypothetical protein